MILDNLDWIQESGKVLQQENFRSELEKIQLIEQSKSKKKSRKELVLKLSQQNFHKYRLWKFRISSTSMEFEQSIKNHVKLKLMFYLWSKQQAIQFVNSVVWSWKVNQDLFGPLCRILVKVAIAVSPWKFFRCRNKWRRWINFAPQKSHSCLRSWPCTCT